MADNGEFMRSCRISSHCCI